MKKNENKKETINLENVEGTVTHVLIMNKIQLKGIFEEPGISVKEASTKVNDLIGQAKPNASRNAIMTKVASMKSLYNLMFYVYNTVLKGSGNGIL